MNSNQPELINAPLGKETVYCDTYNPALLFPIPRQNKRAEIGISSSLPFHGFDSWNAFELSWLNTKGKPMVATAHFTFPCETPHLIESKSFKLYLNSFNNTRFATQAEVKALLKQDLTNAAGSPVNVELFTNDYFKQHMIAEFTGQYLDDLDISCDSDTINLELLNTIETDNNIVDETLYSHLLKSNCPVTGQPDWGSIQIHYRGKRINQIGLLQYIVSYRNHNEFHEQCVERIFVDIMQQCAPELLTVYARYTRRGGLDINPIRSTMKVAPPQNIRLFRQ